MSTCSATWAGCARLLLRLVLLVAGHEAQVTLGDLDLAFAIDQAQDGEIRVVLNDPAQVAFVAVAANPVKDDPGDIQGRIEGLVAEQQGRHAPGHTLGIHDQDDRCLELLGQFRVAVAALEIHGIEEARRCPRSTPTSAPPISAREGLADLVPGHGVEIQIQASIARRLAEPEGVDIVRPLLERLNL